MKTPESARIVWVGNSEIPGSEGEMLCAAITFGSKNKKTGNMATLWIFPYILVTENLSILDFLQNGGDQISCLGCIHSSIGQKTCYVWPSMGKGFSRMVIGLRDRYQSGKPYSLNREEVKAVLALFEIIRLGGYGDPAALPVEFLEFLKSCVNTALGYTHLWNRFSGETRNRLQKILMASVDSKMQGMMAVSQGWRYFRVGAKGELPDKSIEFACPASKEVKEKIGKVITCGDCKKCIGNETPAKNTLIQVHGTLAKRFVPISVLRS